MHNSKPDLTQRHRRTEIWIELVQRTETVYARRSHTDKPDKLLTGVLLFQGRLIFHLKTVYARCSHTSV